MWTIPPLMGQVVINESGRSGRIVHARSSFFYSDWVMRPDDYRPNLETIVQWDDTKVRDQVQLRHVFPVHNAFMDSVTVELTDGSTLRGTREDIQHTLDELIIEEGHQTIRTLEYNQAYREQCLRVTWDKLQRLIANESVLSEWHGQLLEDLKPFGFGEPINTTEF